MKRAQTIAECPFFRRLGDKGIQCEGLTVRGSVLLKLGSRSARDRWVREYCARFATAAARCPLAELLLERRGDPHSRYADYNHQRTAAKRSFACTHDDGSSTDRLPASTSTDAAVKIVANEKRTEAFLSGKKESLLLPDKKIYRHLFREVPDGGGPCLVELIAAGENAGPVMTVFVRRRRSDGVTEPYGGQVWEISRMSPEESKE